MKISKESFKKAEKISKILDSLSSPTRLMITCILIDGERNVKDILEKTGTTKGNISQHLKILYSNDILESRKDGNKIFYYIKDKKIVKLIESLKNLYCPDFKI